MTPGIATAAAPTPATSRNRRRVIVLFPTSIIPSLLPKALDQGLASSTSRRVAARATVIQTAAISSPGALMRQKSGTRDPLQNEPPMRLAQDQMRLQHQPLALARVTIRRHQQACGGLSQLATGLLDHGQGRGDERRPDPIAVADHGDVLRPAKPARAERPDHARGQDSAAAEDGVRPLWQREEVERSLAAVLDGERAQPDVPLVH